MKFSYNFNKTAMNAVLSLSFPVHSEADANVIKAVSEHCILSKNSSDSGTKFNGAQCSILLKVLYDHLTNVICRNLERITNRVFNWRWNLMNGEFVITIQFGNNKTLIKKITALLLKNVQLERLWPAYSQLCKSLKCDDDSDDFKFMATALGKNISNGHIYVSSKVKMEEKDFQDMMKDQLKKLNVSDLKGKSAKHEKLELSSFDLTDNKIKVNNAYAAVIVDHLHTRRVNCKWVGEHIYICSGKSINKHFDDNILELRVKKYLKLKTHLKDALTHDMLASGIPPSLIKTVSAADMKQTMSKYK
jgi:hypothetical protein